MISFFVKKMQLVVYRVSSLITGGARVRRMCDIVCRDFNASVYGAKTMCRHGYLIPITRD